MDTTFKISRIKIEEKKEKYNGILKIFILEIYENMEYDAWYYWYCSCLLKCYIIIIHYNYTMN